MQTIVRLSTISSYFNLIFTRRLNKSNLIKSHLINVIGENDMTRYSSNYWLFYVFFKDYKKKDKKKIINNINVIILN